MTEFLGIEIPVNPWLMPALIIGVIALCAFLISCLALWVIKGIVQRTSTGRPTHIFKCEAGRAGLSRGSLHPL